MQICTDFNLDTFLTIYIIILQSLSLINIMLVLFLRSLAANEVLFRSYDMREWVNKSYATLEHNINYR